MDIFFSNDGDDDPYKGITGGNHVRDTVIQLVLSLVIGITAFIAFCVSIILILPAVTIL